MKYCIVYSGRFYGMVHSLIGVLGGVATVECRGLRFTVPTCDVELIP